jgi:hypothetical protein
METLHTGVWVWWAFLAVVSVLNLGLWAYSARLFMRRRKLPGFAWSATRWPHLALSFVYVVVCGFRSLLPRADVQRIVLYDSWLSSVFVGRSVATIAELCFAAQWALLLHELARGQRQRFGMQVARVVLPVIALAEVCSWYAVLSTNYLGNTLEQSLWTGTVALVALALVPMARNATPELKRFLYAGIVASGAFVAFMCAVDVRMYFMRFLEDEAQGRPYLAVADGLRDVSTRWVVTHAWADWHQEIAWMSLYFSVAVWISIALVHTPRAAPRLLGASYARSATAVARGAGTSVGRGA